MFFRGDDVFFQSTNAIILPILTPFFLLGLGRLLWQLHTVRGSLLVWWIIGTSLSNNLIRGSFLPITPRHNVVYGVLMVVTAFGIDTLWTMIIQHVRIPLRRWVSIGFVGFLLLVTGIHIHHYFGTVVPLQYRHVYGLDANLDQPKPAFDNMIRRAVDLPDNTTVIAFTDWAFPLTHKSIVPVYYGRDPEKFRVLSAEPRTINASYFALLPHNINYVFSFTRYHEDRLIDMIDDYFTITRIEGSLIDVPESVEMIFVHASLEDNPPIIPAPVISEEAQ